MRFVLAAFALLALLPDVAPAQTWPAKPVRIVVAYPAGGGIDVMARQLAERPAPRGASQWWSRTSPGPTP